MGPATCDYELYRNHHDSVAASGSTAELFSGAGGTADTKAHHRLYRSCVSGWRQAAVLRKWRRRRRAHADGADSLRHGKLSLCHRINYQKALSTGEYHSFAASGLLIATGILLPLALITSGVPANVIKISVSGLVFLDPFPTELATILLTIKIKRAGPTFLSLVNYQVPAWTVIIGLTLLGEAIPGHFFISLATILTGLSIAQNFSSH